jgi:hypothetical protein
VALDQPVSTPLILLALELSIHATDALPLGRMRATASGASRPGAACGYAETGSEVTSRRAQPAVAEAASLRRIQSVIDRSLDGALPANTIVVQHALSELLPVFLSSVQPESARLVPQIHGRALCAAKEGKLRVRECVSCKSVTANIRPFLGG